MLFSDLYIGVPYGTPYPDYTEIIRFTSRLDTKDQRFDGSMKIVLESDLNKEVELASRIYI